MMDRGEVWWALLDEERPVVLLSRDGAEELRAIQVVAPAGTDITDVAIEVRLGNGEGLANRSRPPRRPGRRRRPWSRRCRRRSRLAAAGRGPGGYGCG